jgi:hypothetical protein
LATVFEGAADRMRALGHSFPVASNADVFMMISCALSWPQSANVGKSV